MDLLSKRDLGTHVTVVGWLQIVNGLLGIMWGVLLATLILGAGMALKEAIILRILLVAASVLGGLFFVLSVPGIVAGIGLLRRASWSRVMALVLAVFELVLFPIGTLLGAYTIFILCQSSAAELFAACCALEERRLQPAGA